MDFYSDICDICMLCRNSFSFPQNGNIHFKVVDRLLLPSYLVTGFGQKYINVNQICLLCGAWKQKWPHSPESNCSQVNPWGD